MVCQSESPFYYADFIKDLFSRLKNIFPIVRIYTAVIPTYPGAYWTWTMASKKYDPLQVSKNIVTERLSERKISNDLKWVSADIYNSSFVLPPFLLNLLD